MSQRREIKEHTEGVVEAAHGNISTMFAFNCDCHDVSVINHPSHFLSFVDVSVSCSEVDDQYSQYGLEYPSINPIQIRYALL